MPDGARRASGDILDAAMPFLRRYGRALSGDRLTGDMLAAKARRLTRPSIQTISARDIRLQLYRSLHQVWCGLRGSTLAQTAARRQLLKLTPNSRETLLLRAIEEFSFPEIAGILGVLEEDVPTLFETALTETPYRTGSRVLIIEDDPLLAMDISHCLSEMGCQVSGVARTAAEAKALAQENPPELVIAGVKLADNSSGLDALSTIQERIPDVQSVLVTPYPERFLTGALNEPAFIISQPHFEEQVHSAVSQCIILSLH